MIGEKVINERNGILGKKCCEKYFKRILGGEISEMGGMKSSSKVFLSGLIFQSKLSLANISCSWRRYYIEFCRI